MTHPDTPVSELMTPQPVSLDPGDTLEHAAWLLGRYPFRHLPVVRLNELVGILSDRDLLLAAGLPRGRRAPGHGAREPRRVEELLRPGLRTAEPTTSARAAVRTLLDEHIGALPVVTAAGRLVGIVTTTDFLRAFQRCACWPAECPPDAQPIERCMSSPVETATPDEDLLEACERLLASRARHLPVLVAGAAVGMLSDRDVRRGLARLIQADRRVEGQGSRRVPRLTVDDVMSRPCLTAARTTPLHAAVQTLLENRIGALPVEEAGRLIGIVTQVDLLAQYAELGTFAA